MITKEELHQWATEEGLRFDQVERDYVILWVLAGVSRSLTSPSDWVFKGGTCLRHCYYPGYRFSEDIDLKAPAQQAAGIPSILMELLFVGSPLANPCSKLRGLRSL